jgi:SAM-dependent methyltransferase
LFQDYRRLSDEHIAALNRLGKDELTRDPTYRVYPPPQHAIAAFNSDYFSARLQRWASLLDSRRVSNALFLRFWWGAAPAFIAERYGAAVSGVDMSPICARYLSENMPAFRVLEGDINGHFSGPFLDTGPYDAIFVFHVLCHSVDVTASIRQIRQLLAPGGIAIFPHEVVRKPSNPFHRIHPNESQLVSLLRTSFNHICRIDDCEDVVSVGVNPFTLKGDVPDFAAS